MGFLQIISFDTDRFDEFVEHEKKWFADTAGRRTSVSTQVYADRDRPGHYVALDWFDSYESAMVNSALPETTALAEVGMSLASGPVEFSNLEPCLPAVAAGEQALRTTLETSTVLPDVFADDVDLDILVPHGRMRSTGLAALEESLRAEAPARDLEHWEMRTTVDGFVAEYAYRTRGVDQPTVAAGILIATVTSGRISRLSLTCAGNWTPETEAEVLAGTGSLGARTPEVVR
jgi:hypothetical protein